MSLVADFIAASRQFADRPALAHGHRRLDYRALLDLARRIAARLARHGVKHGDVVMIALGDTPEHIAGWFAAQWLGAAALPVDHRLPAREMAAIARAMAPRVAVAESDPGIALPWIGVDDLVLEAPIATAPSARNDDVAFLGLSSGTTGGIKAAELTHAHIQARSRVFIADLMGSKPDRFLCVLHLAFGYARAALARLIHGDFVTLLPPPHGAEDIRRAIADHAITSLAVTPNVLMELAEAHGPTPLLPGLGCLQVGAATLTAEQRARARTRVSPRLFEAYATAIGGIVTIATPDDQLRAPGAVGRPIREVELQIVDGDGRPLPPDAIGAIRLRGPSCATRIIGGAEIADERIQDGWVYPGDFGALTRAGDLVLHGRGADIIKRGAVTVFATEIEGHLLTLPGVRDAAVIGVPAATTGEDVVAVVVMAEGATVDSVMRCCRRDLVSYKRPTRIIAIDAMPRNAAGKIVKRELARLFASGPPAPG